jgi:hypothetical protein
MITQESLSAYYQWGPLEIIAFKSGYLRSIINEGEGGIT